MPRLRRRAPRAQQHFGHGKMFHLMFGVDFIRTGYGREFFARIAPGMVGDWERHRDEILAAFADRHPGRRPWIWWRLESGVDIPDGTTAGTVADYLGQPEAVWLAEHGELTAEEMNQLDAGSPA